MTDDRIDLTVRSDGGGPPNARLFLTTRIARRIFILFVVCALAPLLLFAYLTLDSVTQQLEKQAQDHLHDRCKTTGMSILAHVGQLLDSLDSFVQSRALLREAGSSDPRPLPRGLDDRFDWIAIGTADSEILDHAGNIVELPSLSVEELEHLRQLSRLMTFSRGQGGDEVILVSSLDAERFVFAGVRSSFLWGDEAIRSPWIDLTVLSDSGGLLFSTDENPALREALGTHLAANSPNGFFVSDDGQAPHLVSYRTMFSSPQLFRDFVLAESQRQSDVLRPVQAFKKIFLLFGLLTLLAIVLASLVQIRRSMVPIEILQSATLKVSKGDLLSRVTIDSRDEFQGLGASFNHMLDRLVESIEARQRSHEDMIRAQEQAISAAQTEVLFVQNVSHELRTPLTSICSYAEILRDFADDDPQAQREFLEIIAQESARLTQLINDVLKLSTIHSSTVTLKLERFDVTRALLDVVKALRPRALERKIRIELDAPQGLETDADVERIKEVWANLILNAVKFSPADSVVEVRAFREGSEVHVEIEDHGKGIAPEDQPVIFERFRQLGDMMCDKPSGTGLGLCISKAIAERHGGDIVLVSAPGVGSIFRVELPNRSAVTRTAGGSPEQYLSASQAPSDAADTGQVLHPMQGAQANDEGMAVVKFHSHPSGYPHFSETDDQTA